MSVPFGAPVRTMELVRTAARRRFLAAATFFAIGTLSLAGSQGLVSILGAVGVVTGLILGSLLQVLGLIAAAYGATVFQRMHPLSEAARAARRLLVAALVVVLPLGAVLAAAWTIVAVNVTSLVLLAEVPFFWGPISSVAAAGLVYAARDLASERMAILAGLGCGGVIAVSVSSASWSLVTGATSLQSGRPAVDLLIATLGFFAIAFAFERDAWVARATRPAPR
jgi:hypothetical protein